MVNKYNCKRKTKMQNITIFLPVGILKKIAKLEDDAEIPNRSEFIRFCIMSTLLLLEIKNE